MPTVVGSYIYVSQVQLIRHWFKVKHLLNCKILDDKFTRRTGCNAIIIVIGYARLIFQRLWLLLIRGQPNESGRMLCCKGKHMVAGYT